MKKSLIFLFVFWSFNLVGQTLPMNPNVKYGRLSNGLTYYIFPNNSNYKEACFLLVSRACPILEEPSESGISHFIEHLLDSKTTSFPKGILPFLERHGGRFGYNIGGNTYLDHTNYYLKDITIDENMLDSCLLAIHDMSRYVLFTERSLNEEKGVVISEINTQSKNVNSYKNKELLTGSIYANMSILGNVDNIKKFTNHDVQNYYNKWYKPEMEAVIITGDVDVQDVEQKIKKLFSNISGDSLRNVQMPLVPDNKEPIIRYAPRNNENIEFDLSYKHNPVATDSLSTKAAYRKRYIQFFVGEMITKRMGELVQQPKTSILEAWSSYGIYLGPIPKKAWKTNITAKNDGDIMKIVEIMLRENQRAIKYGFCQQELEEVKQKSLKQFVNYNLHSQKSNNTLASECREHFIRGTDLLSAQFEYQLLTETLNSIRLEDVNSCMKEFITVENISLFISTPENTVFPKKEKLTKLLYEKFDDILPYKYIAKEMNLVDSYPQKGKIVEERIDTLWNSKILKLSNGAKVILFNDHNEDNRITIGASAKGGVNRLSDKDVVYADCIIKLAEIGGLGRYNASEIKVLSSEKVNLNEYKSEKFRSLVGNAFKTDIELLFQMLNLTFTNPYKDEQAFIKYKESLILTFEKNKNRFDNILTDTVYYAKYGHKVIKLKNAEIQYLDYDYLLNLRSKYYEDIASFNFTIVGNFDEKSILPLIEQYIASIPNQNTSLQIDTLRYKTSNGSKKIDLNFGISANKCKVFNLFTTKMEFTPKSNYELELFTVLLKKYFLEAIRQKEGVYDISVSAGLDLTSEEGESGLTVLFETTTDKVDKLNSIVYSEIKKISDNPPDYKVLENLKKGQIDIISNRKRDHSFWRSFLTLNYTFNINLLANYEVIINSISPERIQEIAKQFIVDNNRINILMR